MRAPQKFKQYAQKRAEGFTIIEVMIVLAVAALIMLIVFLAVPALNRSAHNSQRKSDASHLSNLLSENASNNGGVFPDTIAAGTGSTATTLYLNTEKFSRANPVTGAISTLASPLPTTIDKLYVYSGAICSNAQTPTTTGAASSNYVIYFVDEGSGGNIGQCVAVQ